MKHALRRLVSFLVVSLVVSLAVVASGCLMAGPEDELETNAGGLSRLPQPGVEGGACTVTEGDSAGKSGTYDADGWCCVDGGWTCVECTYSDGTSRCRDGAAVQVRPAVRTSAASSSR